MRLGLARLKTRNASRNHCHAGLAVLRPKTCHTGGMSTLPLPALFTDAPGTNVPPPGVYQKFADALAGCRGELDFTTLARTIYSSDAGNYRVVPQCVFAPFNKDEAILAIRSALALGIAITPRGSGTSCAGNAIGPQLVMDYARHMNRVLEIDPHTRTAVVEPGCIEGTLQAQAGKYGLRFGPDPSTQNRCTIGGMAGNNACGPRAMAWGKTSANVLGLEVIDGAGRHYYAESGDLSAVDGLEELVDAHLEPIRKHMGRFNRQVSGYSLEYLLPENGRNLASALVGSEGTLVSILQLKVRLVEVPPNPVLVAVGYADMIAAGDDVPTVLKYKPLAVEGLDSRLVEVVRDHKGPGAVPALPDGNGWLLCEVGGEDLSTAMATAQELAAAVNSEDVRVYPPGEDAVRLWRIRADGAGLGGRTPRVRDEQGKTIGGNEQAWPGWEDAAVPPEYLGDYLRDFTALMREHGVDGLLYGHFGDGCVHVRLDMPLGSKASVGRSRAFLEDCARLVGRYRGSISGEHGDGRSRSELLQYMYPAKSVELFAQVKHLFDPNNLMNPGVLTRPLAVDVNQREGARKNTQSVTPDPFDVGLRRLHARAVDVDGGFFFREDHGDFTTAVHRCTGVSKCRVDNSASGGFMCPSYLATREETDSTRGRARVLEELTNGGLVARWDDPNVARALDLCLACKACATDCPAGVDMAKYRSEALWRRYRNRIRPLTHYLLGRLPSITRLSASVPLVSRFVNALMTVPTLKNMVFNLVGIDSRRPMPKLQDHRFSQVARGYLQQESKGTPSQHKADAHEATPTPGTPTEMPDSQTQTPGTPTDAQGRKYVLLWADSFSEALDDAGAYDALQLLVKAGYKPLLPPEDTCCGLTWITTGQLPQARKKLEHLTRVLLPFVRAGVPIVGVEPSCTAVLRDDIKDLLPDSKVAAEIAAATHTLAELLTDDRTRPHNTEWLPNLEGQTVVAQPHCHQYSVMGWGADEQLLKFAGANVIKLSGCCGLAGNFGMEKGHYDVSVRVANHSLLPQLAKYPQAVFLADGFSCRTQAEQLAGRRGWHLATLLLKGATGTAPGNAVP